MQAYPVVVYSSPGKDKRAEGFSLQHNFLKLANVVGLYYDERLDYTRVLLEPEHYSEETVSALSAIVEKFGGHRVEDDIEDWLVSPESCVVLEISPYKKYVGQELGENEYLLKIRDNGPRYPESTRETGFLTKLTQKKEIPAAFSSWGTDYHNFTPLPTFVFEEKYREGWKLSGWRFGQSQNWACLTTPEGFTLEIYLDQFLNVIKENTVVNGEIQGKFMWQKNKLVKI